MLYTVGEMAKELNVATSTLRYYDQEGLLPFVQRTPNGIRMFTDQDYSALKIIDCLKKSSLTIKEIKTFFELTAQGDESLHERQQIFYNRKAIVEKQIEEMQKTLSILNYKCWYYDTALANGTANNLESLPYNQIPKEYQEGKKALTK